jgi:xylose dehydrogenase (NAD/NADP)
MEPATNRLPLRWGIMGAARITRKLIPAMQATGAQVLAIAASRRERAEGVANTHGIPRAYEGYEHLLADPDVEAVYLPLANSLHREWLVAIANAGKACLCEKPLVLKASDARGIRARFARAGCRLQEAFMWRHHPQVAWLLDQLVPGRLGELRRLHATFSFNLDRPDDYRWSAAMGGGALWDIGCYGVNAARFFFRAEPEAASFRAWFSSRPDGVDEAAAGWLDFGGGRFATVSCSFT